MRAQRALPPWTSGVRLSPRIQGAPSIGTVMDGAGLVVLGAIGILYGWLSIEHPPGDPLIFWTAGRAASMYGSTWGAADALYVYPPPLAQVLRLLPWSTYVFLWMPLLFVGFWAATRRWSLPVFLVSAMCAAFIGFDFALSNPAVLTFVGNPQILIAAVCVVGFRWPALWAFPILTKLAPGIGLLWFLVRREWRQLGIALGVTGVIVALSILAGPQDWVDFLRFRRLEHRGAVAGPARTDPLRGPIADVHRAHRVGRMDRSAMDGSRRRWVVGARAL